MEAQRPYIGQIMPGGRVRELPTVDTALVGPSDARRAALEAVARREPLDGNRKARRAAKAAARRKAG